MITYFVSAKDTVEVLPGQFPHSHRKAVDPLRFPWLQRISNAADPHIRRSLA